MGVYNQHVNDDDKYLSIKEVCINSPLGIIVFAAKKLLKNHLIKCSDESCLFANITNEGIKYVKTYLIQAESEFQ